MVKIIFISSLYLFSVLNFTISQERVAGKLVKLGIWKSKPIEYVDRDILIGFNKGLRKDDILQVLDNYNVSIQEYSEQKGWALIEVMDSSDIFDIASKLEKYRVITYAEPNAIVRDLSDPNDTDFSKQWYFKNTGQSGGTQYADVDAVRAWSITQGSTDIIIAILDSGIPMQSNALSHSELNDASKIIIGRSYTQDGDSTKDVKGHGTFVAGIIASKTNNNYGIAGLANGCKVLIIKISPNAGATTASIMRNGIDYAADHNAKIINISQGVSASTTIENGIADNDNILFVGAAGNYNGNVVKYPAAYSANYNNVIAVSATDDNDEFASLYSNYGSEINVSAPGGHGKDYIPGGGDQRYPAGPDDIYSTRPNYSNTSGQTNFGYEYGTSFSSPIVSAIAGLMLSKNPNLTPAQLRVTIEHTAEDKGATGRDEYYGYGRVNAYYAMLAVVGPQNFRKTNSNNSYITLAWDAIPTFYRQYYEISRNINNYGWNVIATITSTSYTDTQFQENHTGNDVVQYRIRLKTIDDIYSLYSSIINVSGTSYWQQDKKLEIKQLPTVFSLKQNYPNPFNPATEIVYEIPASTFVSLAIYNSIGQQVAVLAKEHKEPGIYSASWNAKEFSSGTYFCRLQAGGTVFVKKMVLAK